MGIATGIAIFLTIWWTVLFAILPLGTVSHAEAGIDKGDGGDPGAPVNPNLVRKFITTTWVSAILFVILYIGVWLAGRYGWFLPETARDDMVAKGATVLNGGKPRIGAHGTPVIFVHPKNMGGVLVELMETPKEAH